MAITPYRTRTVSPWRELDEMTNRLNRMFDDGVTSAGEGRSAWMPAVNVEETRDALLLSAELPGMKQEDVEIELENNVLTLSGQKEESRTAGGEDDRRFHLWERRWGSFQRSFTLPRTVKADEISATYQDGVLQIHMPKAPEARGRRIEIRHESS
jgi:HSP20 family protein